MEAIPNLLSVAAAMLGTAIIGSLKGPLNSVDTRVRNFTKPFQPLFVLGLAGLLPLAANAIGIADIPTADVWASAPSATLLAVTAREGLLRLTGKKK